MISISINYKCNELKEYDKIYHYSYIKDCFDNQNLVSDK